jgi:hypothetical protein
MEVSMARRVFSALRTLPAAFTAAAVLSIGSLVTTVLVHAIPSSAQDQKALSTDRLTLKGVVADNTTYQGRAAVRLLESDASRNTLGLAIVNGIAFRDGTLDVDVAGRRGKYAVADDRGFIGLAFRVSANADRFEYIYLRPENGRVDDQVRRNHSTQYASHPDFPWPRMRKEWPEKYESYVDLETGTWTHMRIVVSGTTARLFVHQAAQPALVVSDLKLGTTEGGVALWIGAGTEGYFANLRVSP